MPAGGVAPEPDDIMPVVPPLVTVVVVAVVVVDEEDILDLEWTTDIRECTRPRMTPHNHMLP